MAADLEDDDEKSPAQQVREALWTYTGWAAILAVCVGAGVFIGHQLWGDAVPLRRRVESLQAQVTSLKKDREDTSTRLAKVSQERDDCRRFAPGAAPQPAPGASADPALGAVPPDVVVE